MWHRESLGRNIFLGEVEVPLDTWNWDSEATWLPLQPRVRAGMQSNTDVSPLPHGPPSTCRRFHRASLGLKLVVTLRQGLPAGMPLPGECCPLSSAEPCPQYSSLNHHVPAASGDTTPGPVSPLKGPPPAFSGSPVSRRASQPWTALSVPQVHPCRLRG